MKRNLTILVCILLSGVLLNTYNGAVLAKESEMELTDEIFSERSVTLIDKIMEELKNQQFEVVSSGIKVNPEKEIHVRVYGTDEYLNTVEQDIKRVVHELAQETIFKDYQIGVYTNYQGPAYDALKLALENNELTAKITKKVRDNLNVNGYKEINNILVEKQPKKLVINLNTSINRSHDFGKQLEKIVRDSLNRTEIMSILMAENQKLEVNVYNNDQEKIN